LARALFLGGEQQVGNLVGEHAVDLFRHAAVVAPQAGLDVDHLHPALGSDQGAGDGGVDVADHQHRLRPDLVEHRLEALHHLGGLHRVAAGADFEVMVGARDAEIGEEAVAHRRVVMLAGMQQLGGDAGISSAPPSPARFS
jgi:hypothetical protein